MIGLARRDLLKALGSAGIFGLLPAAGIDRAVFAAEGSKEPILIVLHLRGGCDGLNLISPANDPDFIAARISELRVAADGKDAGYALANPLAPGIDFRLHAAAGGLAELYKAGALGFVHACGLTNQTRSHFVATDMIERGVANESDLARVTTGWISRSLDANPPPRGKLEAITAGGLVSNDLNGTPGAMAIPDLGGGLPPIGGPPIANALWQLYAEQQGEVAEAGRQALQMTAGLDIRLPRDEQGRLKPYQPENGANYDPAADFARPLRTIAQLIKMEIGLRVATLDYGNWDTHDYQAGRVKYQIERLSNGLNAFWNDLSAYHDRVTLVTLTEFGRRLRSNKSNGTDHGRASVMAVLGGHVKGGRLHGNWPGLKADQLDEGVDLAVTTDYRQVLSEILDHQYGVKAGTWFPNYKRGGNLGVLT